MNKRKISTVLLVALVLFVLVTFVSLSDNKDSKLMVKAKNRHFHAIYNIATQKDVQLMRVFDTVNTAVAIPDYKRGSVGYQVEVLQRFLNRFCNADIIEDGYWGDRTEDAIARYYTVADHQTAPVYNKYFSYIGQGYLVSQSSFESIIKNFSSYLL